MLELLDNAGTWQAETEDLKFAAYLKRGVRSIPVSGTLSLCYENNVNFTLFHVSLFIPSVQEAPVRGSGFLEKEVGTQAKLQTAEELGYGRIQISSTYHRRRSGTRQPLINPAWNIRGIGQCEQGSHHGNEDYYLYPSSSMVIRLGARQIFIKKTITIAYNVAFLSC